MDEDRFIYIEGPKKLNEQKIIDNFKEYGTIISVEMKSTSCFVEYDNQQAACSAIDKNQNAVLDGSQICVVTARDLLCVEPWYEGMFWKVPGQTTQDGIRSTVQTTESDNARFIDIQGQHVNQANRQRIIETFGKYGNIKYVVMKKGSCILEYYNPLHASNAITGNNGTDLDGSRIKVTVAKSVIHEEWNDGTFWKGTPTADTVRTTMSVEPNNARFIYIEGLEIKLNRKEIFVKIFDTFKAYGTIVSVEIPRGNKKNHRGYAFVEYDNPEDATNAIANWPNGCTIRVDTAVNGGGLESSYVGRFEQGRGGGTQEKSTSTGQTTESDNARFIYIEGQPVKQANRRRIIETFGIYGKIKSVVMKEGSCFVEYYNPLHASNAITEKNGTDMDGSRISVVTAEKSVCSESWYEGTFWEGTPTADTVRTTMSVESDNAMFIYIEGLSMKTRQNIFKKIFETFSKYGNIKSVEIPRGNGDNHLGHAYVEYDHKRAGEAARKDDVVLDGRTIRVDTAVDGGGFESSYVGRFGQGRGGGTGTPEKSTQSSQVLGVIRTRRTTESNEAKCIYIGGLPCPKTKQEIFEKIFETFGTYGTIVSVEIPREGCNHRGYAFVEYEDVNSATTAKNATLLDGQRIRVAGMEGGIYERKCYLASHINTSTG